MLAPSKRFYADKLRSPKALLDGARQAALQIHCWLPKRRTTSRRLAFSAIDFLAAVRADVSLVTRRPTPNLSPLHHPDGLAPDVRR